MSSASVGRNWSTPLGPPISMGGRVREPATPSVPTSMGGRFREPGLPPSVPPYQWGEGFREPGLPPSVPPYQWGEGFASLVYPPRSPHINGGKVSRAWSTPSVPPYQWGEGFRRLGGGSGAEGCSRKLSVSGRASCIAVRSIFPAMTRVSGGGRRMSEVVAVVALANFFCATCEISGSLKRGAYSVVKLHLMLVKHRLGMEG